MVLLAPLSSACKQEYLQLKRNCRVSQSHLFHFLRHVDLERNFWDIRQQVETMFSSLEPVQEMTSGKIISEFANILSLRVQTAACETRRINFKLLCVPEEERDQGHNKAIFLCRLIVGLADARLRELDGVMLERQKAASSATSLNVKPVATLSIAPSSPNRKKKKSKAKGPMKGISSAQKLKEQEEDAYLEAAFNARQKEESREKNDIWDVLQTRQQELQAAQDAIDTAYDRIVSKLLDFLEKLHVSFEDPVIYDKLIHFVITEHNNDLVVAASSKWPKPFVRDLLIEIRGFREAETLVRFDMSKAVQKVALAITITHKEQVKGPMAPFDAETLTHNLLLINSLPQYYEKYYKAFLHHHPIEQVPLILVNRIMVDQDEEESLGETVFPLARDVWFMYSSSPVNFQESDPIGERAIQFQRMGLDSQSALTASKFVIVCMHLIRTDAFPWDRVREKVYMRALLSMPRPPDKQVLYANAPEGLERYCRELLG